MDVVDTRCCRRIGLHIAKESPDRRLFALNLDHDAFRTVRHPAGEIERLGKVVDEGAKADALHATFDREMPTLDRGIDLVEAKRLCLSP